MVPVPAHFRSRAVNQSGVAGDGVVLMCEVDGDLPLRVAWSAAHRPLAPGHSRVMERHTPTGIVTELQLEDLARRDAGPYRCSAANDYGQDEMIIYLTVKGWAVVVAMELGDSLGWAAGAAMELEPPEAPGRVEVLEVASRWVSVAWGAPYSGHAPISHYVVQFREDELGDSPWSNVTVGGGSRTARLGALRPATSYTIRLLAVNDVGAGPPSESTMAVTLQEAPSGPPTDVMAEPTSSESILIRWKPPLVSYSHGEILGYQVAFREVSGATPGAQQVRSVRGRNRLEVTLPSLRQYTRYEVSVRAFNLVGSGPSSPQLYVTTLEGVPDMPPQDLRCTALTSQSVRVRWEPPPLERRNGVVEGYKVFYKHANPRQAKEIKYFSSRNIAFNFLHVVTSTVVEYLSSA
ncbi:unnamed protein product [Timema podura]|uniref:Down syndrome cell adhesion molecule-like protein Dscam2 n=1 Tax=Timema podura TaxID=61482 RepID=A0ABN7P9H3_TIMPD|nr:unnamed protein product [Timema podura]